MKKVLLAFLLLPFTQAAYATDVIVKDAWVRLSPPVAQSTAAYMVVQNQGAQSVKLIGVSSATATSADMHGTRMEGHRMVMFPLHEVEVPPNGMAQFTPGGSHVMLMGLKHPLKEGEAIEIVFQLSNGEILTVVAPVRDMRMSHDHHNNMH